MPVPIQILGIENIQIIDLETLHTKKIENTPTIGVETIQMIETLDIKIIDHAIILTTDQTIIDQNATTIKIDHAIIHRIKIQVVTIDIETTLSHHIGITHVIKNHNKTIGVEHLNIKGKQIRYKQRKKFNQTPGIDNNGSTELQLIHINCESLDIESDTENTISINMIHVENDYKPILYEQPMYSHIYQKT